MNPTQPVQTDGRRGDAIAPSIHSPADCPDPSPEARQASRRSTRLRWLLAATGLLLLATGLIRSDWFARQLGPWLPSEPNVLAQSRPGGAVAPPFDFSNLRVPADEILRGGPPKDGIPALTNPTTIAARQATYLRPDDRVIGLVLDGQARAYPLKILNYHEIVNDHLGGVPVAVTYCPLCDSAAAFDRRTEGGVREFGVSGLLYNSNVIMYDRGARESLWSQMKTEGISGPGAGADLSVLPLELTTWDDWRRRYPNTTVLSPNTGHQRDYERNPYGGYFERPGLMFPARPQSDRLPTKERVLGVWTEGAARAYPESAFSAERRRIADELDGKSLVIEYDPEARSLRVVQAEEGLNWVYSLWFAWYAFHPQSSVFEPRGR